MTDEIETESVSEAITDTAEAEEIIDSDNDEISDNIVIIESSKHKIEVITGTQKPKMPLTNLVVGGAEKVGDIYWAAEDSVLTVTAECDLPDGELMMMVEKIVDADVSVSDVRFKAVIAEGQLSVTAKFRDTGNYLISQDRINRALDRIGSSIHLDFDDIEFDIYVE